MTTTSPPTPQQTPPRRRATDQAGHPASFAERAALLVERTHPGAWLWLSLAVVVLDQATKFLATRFLDLYERVEVLPVLDFTLLHNTGAAFSLLAEASGWQRPFFITLGLGVSLALVVWLWRLPRGERLLPIALALIVGGAIGNVIDRVAHGYVVDFIHAHWGAAYFPAFNLADSAITVGAALLLLDAFREHRG
ncbi:MAG: signal peptidase II [Steroidobacteraceae bacterium]